MSRMSMPNASPPPAAAIESKVDLSVPKAMTYVLGSIGVEGKSIGAVDQAVGLTRVGAGRATGDQDLHDAAPGMRELPPRGVRQTSLQRGPGERRPTGGLLEDCHLERLVVVGQIANLDPGYAYMSGSQPPRKQGRGSLWHMSSGPPIGKKPTPNPVPFATPDCKKRVKDVTKSSHLSKSGSCIACERSMSA